MTLDKQTKQYRQRIKAEWDDPNSDIRSRCKQELEFLLRKVGNKTAIAEAMTSVSQKFDLNRKIRHDRIDELLAFLCCRKIERESEEGRDPENFGWEYGVMILKAFPRKLNDHIWKADEIWSIKKELEAEKKIPGKTTRGKIRGSTLKQEIKKVRSTKSLVEQFKELDEVESTGENEKHITEKVWLAASLYTWQEFIQPLRQAIRSAYNFDPKSFDIDKFLQTYGIESWENVLYGRVLEEPDISSTSDD